MQEGGVVMADGDVVVLGRLHGDVHGGQNGDNAWQAVEAGADALVAGSAVFGAGDYAQAIGKLRRHPAPPSSST